MAAGVDSFCLIEEDFEAILDILAEDEALEEQYESSVSNVSTR